MYEKIKKIIISLLIDLPNKGLDRGLIQQVKEELFQYDGQEFEQVVYIEFLELKSEINRLANAPPTATYEPLQQQVRLFILRLDHIIAKQKTLLQETVKLPMNLIITWSKQFSHDIAKYLKKDWLPHMFPELDVWVSSEDIQIGKAWFPELIARFNKTTYSIVCITSENVESPWVYYEVGIIAGKEGGVTSSYLVGVSGSKVKDTPLGQYQYAEANRDGTWKLVRSINTQLGEKGAKEDVLEATFTRLWPRLNSYLVRIVERMGELETKVTTVRQPPITVLSDQSKRLLFLGAQSDGSIMFVEALSETCLQVNRVNLIEEENPRVIAKWKTALAELVTNGYIVDKGHKGEVFELTDKGYERGEMLIAEDPVLSLSKSGKSLLQSASKSHDGHIQYVETDGGFFYYVNGTQANDPHNPQDTAIWKEGFDQILARKFIEVTHQPDMFMITQLGYEAAKKL